MKNNTIDKNAIIETEQVYLRAITLSDVNEYYVGWLNDKAIIKGLMISNTTTTIESLREYVESNIRNPEVYMYAIVEKQTDLHIGNIKIDKFDWVSSTCELGILIGNKTFWGKGIATEVVRAILVKVFVNLSIRKVLLAVFSNNPVAIKLYSKIGFKREGCLKDHILVEDEYVDKCYMSIFKTEFFS